MTSMLLNFIFKDILSLSDEMDHWKSVSTKQKNSTSSERRRADLFVRLLEPAVKECLCLENSAHTNAIISKSKSSSDRNADNVIGLGLTELLDVLDTHVTDTLDELWRCLDPEAIQPFPESRMRQLIEAIGYWIVKIIKTHLGCIEHGKQNKETSVSSIWTLEFSQVSYCLILYQVVLVYFPTHLAYFTVSLILYFCILIRNKRQKGMKNPFVHL
ncbi:unnamed protein product [Echinostoma caproni]|uniref:FANCI_S4 domain-containing protein n=1 Tax=Echinostoma caproni TaxID=27848 RepID=A0A183B6U8_9TREM|nr:unnamed protein product [Echinostoma caproni]